MNLTLSKFSHEMTLSFRKDFWTGTSNFVVFIFVHTYRTMGSTRAVNRGRWGGTANRYHILPLSKNHTSEKLLFGQSELRILGWNRRLDKSAFSSKLCKIPNSRLSWQSVARTGLLMRSLYSTDIENLCWTADRQNTASKTVDPTESMLKIVLKKSEENIC